MAQAKVKYLNESPIESIDISLTKEEADALLSVLYWIAVQGIGKQTYKVFEALSNTRVLDLSPLRPTMPSPLFSAPYIVFEES